MPGGHKSPGGLRGWVRGGHGGGQLPGQAGQQLRIPALPVEDVSTQSGVYVGPVWGHEGAVAGEWEGLGGELGDPYPK